MKTLTSEQILNFLRDNPEINIRKLCRDLKIPDGTIRRTNSRKDKRDIPKKYLETISKYIDNGSIEKRRINKDTIKIDLTITIKLV